MIIRTGKQARQVKHRENISFHCSQCGIDKPVTTTGGTGYAVNRVKDHLICYDCCGANDRAEMIRTGAITLYLSQVDELITGALAAHDNLRRPEQKRFKVTNWPGTLEFKVTRYSLSRHNMAGKNGRTDFWFNGPDGFVWHGYQVGKWNQVARCKRTKTKA